MKVRVTQEIIDASKRNTVFRTPVAIAFSQALQQVCHLSGRVIVSEDGRRFFLPEDVANWIEDYNTGLSMYPFEMEVP